MSSLTHLSSGGLHDGLVFSSDVAESKGQFVGESGGKGVRAQVNGHQGLDLLFVHASQESDLVVLGLEGKIGSF